jgi:hypothetical protein
MSTDSHDTHVRIPAKLWERFKVLAEQEAPSLNAAIVSAIAEWVRRRR